MIVKRLGTLTYICIFQSRYIFNTHTRQASPQKGGACFHFLAAMSFCSFLAVFLGGGLGSVCRFAISSLMPVPSGHLGAFPFRTFLANILGCFFIGLLSALFLDSSVRPELKNFLVAGFCGGFTTFSTFSREGFDLLASGQYAVAVTYMALSLVLGVAFVAFGFWLIGRWAA